MHVGTKTSTSFRRSQGFTIVELLIVIVIVAILATLTVVAYNGIQKNAQVSAVQSSLEQANKKLGVYFVDNDAYPPDLSAFNALMGTNGVSGTTYQYIVDNNAAPPTYCITATNGTTSYKTDSSNTKALVGGCSGHIVGGVMTITNLVGNPSLTTNGTGWNVSGDFSSNSRIQVSGEWVYTATRNATGAAVLQCNTGPCIATTVSGNAYTASATVTSTVNTSVTLRIRRAGGTITLLTGSSVALVAGVPQRISVTGTLTDTSVYVALYSASGTVGDTFTMDRVLLTEGSTVYNYGDGDTAGWVWNGTANASTSTGPAQ